MAYSVKIITPLGVKKYDASILNGIKEQVERKENEYLFDIKKTLSGQITFIGQDFNLFLEIDNSQLRYEDIFIRIVEIGTDGIEYIRSIGTMSLLDATFNKTKCEVTIPISAEDKYNEFDKKKDIVYNLLNWTTSLGKVFDKYDTFCHTSTNEQYTIPNGVKLLDVLDYMYKQINPLGIIESKFFSNEPFSYFKLHQKSDAIRRTASKKAWKMEYSLSGLLNDICKLLNLRYRINSSGNLEIDNINDLLLSNQINDLTTGNWAQQSAGLNKWSYKKTEVFKYEIFKSLEARNIDFATKTIIYDNSFVNKSLEKSEIIYENNFVTDLEYVLSIKQYKVEDVNGIEVNVLDDSVDYSGVVLIAANKFGRAQKLPISHCEFPSRLNNVLSFKNLIRTEYLKNNRIFQQLKSDNDNLIASKTKRTKYQNSIILKDCGGDMIKYDALTKTEVGENGFIEKAEFDFINRKVTIDISFDSVQDSQINNPKTIIDWYKTEMNTNFDSAFLQQNTLIDNDNVAPNSTVTEETKSTFMGGIVTIYSDGSFKYIPPHDFYGLDTFDYIVTEPNGYSALGIAKMAVRYPFRYVKNVINFVQMETYPDNDGYTGCNPEEEYSNFYWFRDAAGTQPLDVTGYDIPIDVVTHSGAQIMVNANSGTSQYGGVRLNGCGYINAGSGSNFDYNSFHKLDVPAYNQNPNPDYILIP